MTAPGVSPGQLVQWLLEYQGRITGILERAWTYSHPSYVEKGLPALYGVLQQHPQLLLGTPGGDAKAQKEFLKGLDVRAPAFMAELQPLVSSLKVISQNFNSIAQLLAELHRILGSLTLRSYPDLLHHYMDTFCGVVRTGLLLEDVPRRAAAQMVRLACAHARSADKAAAELLVEAVGDPIFTAPSLIAHLQSLFRPCMPRIAQVLELVVGPALSVAGSCEGVAEAALLDMSAAAAAAATSQQHAGGAFASPGVSMEGGFASFGGGGGGNSTMGGGGGSNGPGGSEAEGMGLFGMTRRQVYAFLRHREAIRAWGFLGFLVFPEVLRQAGSAQRLSALLADGFALHVHKDRLACCHALALTHLGGALHAALGNGGPAGGPSAGGGGGGGGASSGGGLGALLGRGMAKLRKSQTDDDGSEAAPRVHPLLAAAAAEAVAAAPLQHRMWRAFLTGQLRNMHAACAACPSMIPGQMEMLLAALSLAREELLWYCRHVNRAVPADLAPLLPPVAKGGALSLPAEDGLQALQLLTAMDAMHQLLVTHHVALCKQIRESVGADLQAHVVPCTPRVEIRLRQAAAQAAGGSAAAATAAAAGGSGLQPFKDMTELLRSVLLSSAPPPDAAGRVSTAAGIWVYVGLQLAAVEPGLKAAKVLQYAEDTRYLDVLQKSLDAARLLYAGPLLHAAAADLAPGLTHAVEPVLATAAAALGGGRLEGVSAALGAMQGLHWLLPNRAEAYAAATAAAAAASSRRSTAGSGGGSSSRNTSAAGARSVTGSGANGAGAGAGGGSSRRLQVGGPQPDDLPHRCMDLVVGCIRQLLAPLVQAPLVTTQGPPPGGSTGRIPRGGGGHGSSHGPERSRPSLEGAAAPASGAAPAASGGNSSTSAGGSSSLRARLTSGSSLMKVIGAARSITPERLRAKSEAAASRRSSAGGSGAGGGADEAAAAVEASGRALRNISTGGSSAAAKEGEAGAAAELGTAAPAGGSGAASATSAAAPAGLLPAATELAARLLPLVIALDTGRMLAAETLLPGASSPSGTGATPTPNTSSGGASCAGSGSLGAAGSSSGGGSSSWGSSGEGEGVEACRAQLVVVLRDSFARLLLNTATAIKQSSAPLPSQQLAPLRRYLEVVAALAPALPGCGSELGAELARLLVQQASAPTLQAIGLDASGSAPLPPRSTPLSTNADTAAAPKVSALTPVGRINSVVSATSAGGATQLGPMSRALSSAGHNPMHQPQLSPGGAGPLLPPAPSERGAAQALGPMASALPSGSVAGAGGSVHGPGGPLGSGASPYLHHHHGGSVLRAFASWLWTAVILDERRAGVTYDVDTGAFTTATGLSGYPDAQGAALAAATCVRELALLFEVFGPGAAADLGRGCSGLVAACLEQLQVALEAHCGPLAELLDASRLRLDARVSAVQRALPRLLATAAGSSSASVSSSAGSLAAVFEAVQRLGRCMLLRAQLGRAAAVAAERSADFMLLALREISAPIRVTSGDLVASSAAAGDAEAAGAAPQQWGELLRLAAAGVGGGGGGAPLPQRDDPLVTAHLAALLPSLDAAQRWHRLPALLAVLLVAPQLGAYPLQPSSSASGSSKGSKSGSSKSRSASAAAAAAAAAAPPPGLIRALGVVNNTAVVGLSLALQSAMALSLHPAASQFLLGCESPAAACLCAYQRLGTGVVQAAMAAALQAAAAAAADGCASGAVAAPGSASSTTGAAAAATAAKQQLLAALERLPLLRDYAYTFAAPDDVMAAEAAAAVAAAAEDCAAAAAAAAAAAEGLLAAGGPSASWSRPGDSSGAGLGQASGNGTRVSLEGALGWWPSSNDGAAPGEGIASAFVGSGSATRGAGAGLGAGGGALPGTPSKRSLVGAASSAGAASALGGEGRTAGAAAAGAQSLAPVPSCEPSLAGGRWSGAVDAWRPAARLVPLLMGHVEQAIAQADGHGGEAVFVDPTHMASSGSGAIYVQDQNRIRKVQLPEHARYQAHQEGRNICASEVRVTTLPQQVPAGISVTGMVHMPSSGANGECLVLSSATAFYKLPLRGAGSASLERFVGRDGAPSFRTDGSSTVASVSCINPGLARDGAGNIVFLDFNAGPKNTYVRCVDHVNGRVTTLYDSLPPGSWEWPCILPNGCLAVTCGKDLLVVDLGLAPPQPPPRADNPPPPRTLAADLGSLLDAGSGADLTIRVSEEAFRAHRAILVARCDYFAKRLAEDAFADGAQEELDLPDAEPEAFRVLLRWLYTGAADIPAAHAAEVAVLADRLALPELCAEAQAAVLASVAPRTVVQSLLWAAACAPERGCSFMQLLAQLKRWYVAHYDKVRSQARESVVELMARNPQLAMELQDQLVTATERRASKKQRT
ncbi:hypothetical protein HYH02_006677 [Chlamydomonas schloesseri]|uniref:BTB domain-containing protein n=1 Tax=Chlamydomonas schloesseri TaxID=2026947 RepID=A0A835SZ24_9CHLO|nr:hypothetical protein HYH02_006677 [Chlamydomonas schloesseri]|eukprot:KAG2432693.1 hypothetical protein HYH02_006677 [Chlamydomonas schloesseri]